MKNGECHPSNGIRYIPARADKRPPTAKKLSIRLIRRLRYWVGAISLRIVTRFGTTPPNPTPVRNRQIPNVVASKAKALTNAATLNNATQNSMIGRLPRRSAVVPRMTAPNIMPSMELEPSIPACEAVRFHSVIRWGSTEP
ncbi:hypothetical protein D3C87_1385440 [compost metagenome]